VLSTNGRYRYVRRLKVLSVMSKERRIQGLERTNALVGERDEEGEGDEGDGEDEDEDNDN